MAIVQYGDTKIDNVASITYGLQFGRDFHNYYVLRCLLLNGERTFINLDNSEFLRFNVNGNVLSLDSYSNDVTIFGNVNRAFSANVAIIDGIVTRHLNCNNVIQSTKKVVSYKNRTKNVVTIQGDLHTLDLYSYRGKGDIIVHGCCDNVVVQNTVRVKGNIDFLDTSKCTFCIK